MKIFDTPLPSTISASVLMHFTLVIPVDWKEVDVLIYGLVVGMDCTSLSAIIGF